MYAEYLSQCGFDTTAIDDGDEALLQVPSADVLVTAIRIHGSFDGVELVRRVRLQDARKPLIVVSAVVQNADSAQRAGSNAFLPKPCTPGVLVEEIRKVLEVSRAVRNRCDHDVVERMMISRTGTPVAETLK